MPQAQVAMTVRNSGPGSNIIDIAGDLTGFCEDVMMDAYAQAGADGTKSIILNFDGLEYMNSSGIGLLVTMLIRAQRNGQRLACYGLSEHYRQIFSLTRLDEAIGVYTTEGEALAGT